MKTIIWKALIGVLAVGFYLYTGQEQMFLSVLLYYLFGRALLRLILKPSHESVLMYDMFCVIYGFLTLLTHIELIHNPYEDYFVHWDASNSFFYDLMDRTAGTSWSDMINITLFSPIYVEYPLPALFFSILQKIGAAAGIENIRLFLRMHVFYLGAIVPAMISNLFVRSGMDLKRVRKLTICFGLFTYIYITSAIFSRDLHVCLIYTIAIYYVLIKKKHELLSFALLFILASGCRWENGLLLLVLFLAYYMSKIKNQSSLYAYVAFIGVFAVVALVASGYLDEVLDTLNRYDEKAHAFSGGLFMKFYSLPFPFNTIIMSIYILLEPLPIWTYISGEGMTYYTLPFILSPYIMSIIFVSSIWFLSHRFRMNDVIVISMLFCIFAYVCIIKGSPDLRRAYAPIPGLFMAYGLVSNQIPRSINKLIKKGVWPALVIINLFFIFYLQ